MYVRKCSYTRFDYSSYSDDRELIMDVLKYGSSVRVLSPESLRAKVSQEIERMRKEYDV
ncbi:WCX domain-containing protein [Acidithiobacillus albertensis]|uniref:WYL domain-containing protein n=1 Tax=Acidithiobacillus albertensis TaxID=119978 RepID=UPI00384A84BA